MTGFGPELMINIVVCLVADCEEWDACEFAGVWRGDGEVRGALMRSTLSVPVSIPLFNLPLGTVSSDYSSSKVKISIQNVKINAQKTSRSPWKGKSRL